MIRTDGGLEPTHLLPKIERLFSLSAQKIRLVVDQVRGRNVNDALSILGFSRKLVAQDLQKLLKSALANAQQTDPNVDVDSLVVSAVQVDDGPPLKRVRHQSMGRVYRVLKRSCHVTIRLDTPGGAPEAADEDKGR